MARARRTRRPYRWLTRFHHWREVPHRGSRTVPRSADPAWGVDGRRPGWLPRGPEPYPCGLAPREPPDLRILAVPLSGGALLQSDRRTRAGSTDRRVHPRRVRGDGRATLRPRPLQCRRARGARDVLPVHRELAQHGTWPPPGVFAPHPPRAPPEGPRHPGGVPRI